MLLQARRSQILLVDMQERLLPSIHEVDALLDRCVLLLQTAAEMGVPTLVSEQYPKGLGHTAPRVIEAAGAASVMEKMHFSCASDPGMAAHVEKLAKDGRNQLIVAGVESHVCVLQSALEFKAKGLDVYVVADAVASRKPESRALALARMEAGGVTPINLEMLAFEWLHIAGTPEFKTVSKLMR
jgi:nicotinamidase-related amidase